MATERRPWPRHALKCRNQAADRIMDALIKLYDIRQNGHTKTRTGNLYDLAEVSNLLWQAACWLQQAGAPIEPLEDWGPPSCLD
jgi:hypothetical protein